jgi:hypothetical protein
MQAPQPHVVEIVKIFVEGSIHAYRESRKRDKYLVELSTRANDPDMRSLIVKCLNEHQLAVRKAQHDERNAELMAQLQEVHEVEAVREELQLAQAVPDPMDILSIPEVVGKRARKPVIHFRDEFNYYGSDAEDEPKARPKRSRQKRVLADEDYADTSSLSSWTEESVSEFKGSDIEDEGNSNEGDGGDEKEDPAAAARKAKRLQKIAEYEAMRNEFQEDEGVRQLRLLLTADADKVYTEDDLDDESILERGLEITHCFRLGQQPDKVPSIHIKVRYAKALFNDNANPNSTTELDML